MVSNSILSDCAYWGENWSLLHALERLNPTNIYLFKVKKGKTRKIFEINSKLAIKTPEMYDFTKFSH